MPTHQGSDAHDDAEPHHDSPEDNDHQGRLPSWGFVRIFHDIDIQESDRKIAQHRAGRDGGR